MAQDDLAWMAMIFAGALFLASFLGWRGGDSRADVTLMGATGAAFAAVAGVLAAF